MQKNIFINKEQNISEWVKVIGWEKAICRLSAESYEGKSLEEIEIIKQQIARQVQRAEKK